MHNRLNTNPHERDLLICLLLPLDGPTTLPTSTLTPLPRATNQLLGYPRQDSFNKRKPVPGLWRRGQGPRGLIDAGQRESTLEDSTQDSQGDLSICPVPN